MAALLNLPATHLTASQEAFRDARVSHEQAMKQAGDFEVAQYDKLLYSLQVYGQSIKPALSDNDPVEGDQRTEFGTQVGVKAAELWATNKGKTKAILQGTADSMGITYDALIADLATATLPAEFAAARAAIANA